MLLFSLNASEKLNIEKLTRFMINKYDDRAGLRVNAWRNIINSASSLSEAEQLAKVNQFFNLFQFVDDIDHWGVKDYWATPIEFIGTSAGDCEDFSIAKYFSLLEMGVNPEKLRLTYVKAVKLNQFHMVVAYYPTPSDVPLILDNLDPKIKPAIERSDLVPIFSFNGQKLWLNKQKSSGQVVGSAQRLSHWQDLRKRYQLDEFKN